MGVAVAGEQVLQIAKINETAECPACAEPSGIVVDWDMLGAEGLKCVACGAALEVQHERSCVAWSDDESDVTGLAINDSGETAVMKRSFPG